MDTFKHFPDCIYLWTGLRLEVFRSGSGSANMMFVSTVQTYPIQYRSNKSACFLRSQTPSPPYCRGGDPPPASRRRRSGRRNEAGWPWSYREAEGTTPISKHTTTRLSNRSSTGERCPPFRAQSVHWWAARSPPPGGRRTGWRGCGTAGYGWCSRNWREAGRTLLRIINTVGWNAMEWRYSRQNSKGDQGDGEAEDGDGAANITNGSQRHLVASGQLHRETINNNIWSTCFIQLKCASLNYKSDQNNTFRIYPIHLCFLFTI